MFISAHQAQTLELVRVTKTMRENDHLILRCNSMIVNTKPLSVNSTVRCEGVDITVFFALWVFNSSRYVS